MRRMALVFVAALLALGSLACTISIPAMPSIDVPRVEVGEMQEYTEQVPRAGASEANVEIEMGAGDLTLSAGEPATLFSGVFRTNVAAWVPEVTWANGHLEVTQSSVEGMPEAGAENHWELAFSPEVALDLSVTVGAGNGELDCSGLSLSDLTVETGAADLVLRFDEPNRAQMSDLIVRAGVANLRVEGIGNARSDSVEVESGVGNVVLDFGGDWTRSARVEVTAGTGSLTLRFPANVGVRVAVEGGLGNVNAGAGFRESGGAYVNDAYDTADIRLDVTVEMGVGNVTLAQISE